MSILVFGKTGQVARELQARAPVVAIGRDEADLSDPAACAAVIASRSPGAVINAAAYTGVDKAEEEEALATLVNGEAPTAMAKACALLDIPFVHISTDYVFDGSGHRPWQTSDPRYPSNAYGRSKLKGERGVEEAGGRFAVLRTSWVFSSHGNNFLKTMVRLSETRSELKVVDDQIGGPTPTADIADACLTIARALQQDAGKSGLYHFSGTPNVSWAHFARTIFDAVGREVSVLGIPTSEYPTPAVRPLNSRLDCSATVEAFGIAQPDWRGAVKQILDELEIAP
ncbi:MAG: dTDP-4-dehydrorhamnose reductase [Sphingomonadaceae bacterium]|nr:dTDP-4-dehydrorhamnose reductase [Sphingomonadaceae bacterium]